MNEETLAVLDDLMDQMSLTSIMSITKVNRSLRIPSTPDYNGTIQSIDMDIILLNFPFLN